MKARAVLALALVEMGRTIRGRWVLAYAAAYFLIGLTLTQFTLLGVSSLDISSVGRVVAGIVNLTLYLASLVALTLGAMTVVADLESGTTEWLCSTPISWGEIIQGKFLGLLAAITAATFLGLGLVGWLLALLFPPASVARYTLLAPATVALTAACLAVGILASTMTRSRTAALGAAFTLWLTFIFLYDLGLIYLTLALGLSESQVFSLALINPVEAARVLILYILDPQLALLGRTGIYIAMELGGLLPLLPTAALLALTLLALVVASYLWRRRDVV